MKKLIIFCLFVSLAGILSAEKLLTFNEVLKPEMLKVSGNEIYVVEGSTIFMYSLENLKLIRKFGKKGEGPGELKSVPKFSNTVLIYPEFVLAESIDKVIYFSKKGEVLKEMRKYPETLRIMPVGKNFVGKKIGPGENGKRCSTLNLFNPKMEKIKEFYRQEFFQQGMQIQLIPESLNFWVYEDKIFIEKSSHGFLIEVFDAGGKELYKIKKEYKGFKVTDEHKEKIIEALKAEPHIKIQGWENIKKMITFKFADSFPPIRDIFINSRKIYVRTFDRKDNKDKYLVMDLKGGILKSAYLPRMEYGYLTQLVGLGPKYYWVDNDKFYYLKDNEADETWELHVTAIK